MGLKEYFGKVPGFTVCGCLLTCGRGCKFLVYVLCCVVLCCCVLFCSFYVVLYYYPLCLIVLSYFVFLIYLFKIKNVQDQVNMCMSKIFQEKVERLKEIQF